MLMSSVARPSLLANACNVFLSLNSSRDDFFAVLNGFHCYSCIGS
jgi:hypothetical protein